jgi:hypothetical protein
MLFGLHTTRLTNIKQINNTTNLISPPIGPIKITTNDNSSGIKKKRLERDLEIIDFHLAILKEEAKTGRDLFYIGNCIKYYKKQKEDTEIELKMF